MNIRYANLDEAKKAVIFWNGIPDSVEHIGNFSNSVFKFKTISGLTHILRFTDSQHRSYDEVLGELEYLVHLKVHNVPVCHAITAINGLLAIEFKSADQLLICSVVSYIEGTKIIETSVDWNKDFFHHWGRNLSLIHRASRSFRPQKNQRWVWNNEHLILNARKLIPDHDNKSLNIFQNIISECNNLDKNEDNFGLIHADHAPQNFIIDPVLKKMTTIDFGNCCYHWYLSDVAISLSTLRNKKNCEDIKLYLLDGYSETETLPSNYEFILDLLIKLRVVYVYLDRLNRFGLNPNLEQKQILNVLKEKVHSEIGWPYKN